MLDENKLNGALQENILTLLVFSDDYCKLIRSAVKPTLFESSVFRTVAEHAIDFVDQYGEAIKDHLPDHLEGILKGDDARKASTYKNLLDNLYASKDTVNSKYVMQQLHRFVRLQGLKSTIIKATEALADGRVDEAETALETGLNAQVIAFEGGLDLSSPTALQNVLDNPEEEGFDLGIPELDRNGIIPRRKELMMLIAPRGKGKSWFATHVAKRGIMARWNTVIITLEMSERRYGARMLQTFFSLTRRQGTALMPRLILDKKDGSLLDISKEEVARLALMNPDDRSKISAQVKRGFSNRAKLRIKEFPTNELEMSGLVAYLDGLERFEKFTPDLLIIDYPDLMNIDAKNLRTELGSVIAKLRGLGVKRNMAVVAMSQGNREAERASTVTGDMVAEDISKLATADTVLTYSQTPAEYKLQLARLLVEKARNEEAKMQVLVTQSYAVGQFCLDSMMLESEYWDVIKDRDGSTAARPARRRAEDED